MGAEQRKMVLNHAAEVLRERNELLAAVKRLTGELRRLEARRADVDTMIAEASEATVKWANARARERANSRRFLRKLKTDGRFTDL
jgi:hypothetical protein